MNQQDKSFVIDGKKINTSFDGDYGWEAFTDNYSASVNNSGYWESDEPLGTGLTRQEAIDDLIEKLDY